MATTQIIPFTTNSSGAGGNRLSPTAYAALTTLLANGFQAGTALSVQVNTVLAQTSFMAAGLAGFCVAQGISIPDDGNLTNLIANITAALTAFISTGSVPIAAAGGTSDAITATYSPAIALTDKQQAAFIATAANTTTTPTFAPNGLTAHTITKRGGQPLIAGDIPGQYAYMIVEYNLANTRWELLDPQGTSTEVGFVKAYTSTSVPANYLECNGAAISRTTYATLFAVTGTIFGVGDGSTTFNLPDLRGYFVRGWSDSGSVDSGRSFGSVQAMMVQAHKHIGDTPYSATGTVPPWGSITYSTSQATQSAATSSAPRAGLTDDGTGTGTPTSGGSLSGTPNSAGVVGAETRPVNVSMMFCVRYN